MGSRAVPHRLNAQERKEFELAKKKGYVVQQANCRRYPLINTYRNYCDALGLLCIHIEQGIAGSADQVVINFTPLRLSEADLLSLRDNVWKSIISVLATDNQTSTSQFISEVYKEGGQVGQVRDKDDSFIQNSQGELASTESFDEHLQIPDGLEGSIDTLRFQALSRSMTKIISQTALDTWRSPQGLAQEAFGTRIG